MTTASALASKPRHVPVERVVDFDLYNLPEAEDLHHAWKLLRAQSNAGIVWTPRNSGHWIVLDSHLIESMYQDYERFSNRIIFVPKEAGEQYKFVPNVADPPQHHAYRALLNSALSPKALASLEVRIREEAIRLIEAVRGQGECEFIDAYSRRLPVHIFLDMCDLPRSDGPRLKAIVEQFTRPTGTMTIEQATQQMYDYLQPYVDARRGDDGKDLISHLVNGTFEGRQLTNEECLSLSAQVLMGGLDTVANFLGFVMHFLARHPAHRRALAQNKDTLRQAVDEFLRRFAVATSARVTTKDTEVDGVLIREGDMVILPNLLYGLDERIHPEPMKVDFDRSSKRHLAFATGRHNCPGRFLAQMETRVTLEEWMCRIPDFELKQGANVRYLGGVVATVTEVPLTWRV
jgi:cytochrome P450